MLFYRSVLGLEPRDSVELAAPDGLVRSRAVTSADGSVRFALNVPPAPASGAAGRAAARRASPATTRSPPRGAMRERGAPLLAIPENYYDDLAARARASSPT